MEDLPNILIRKTALPLTFTEITYLCRTNKKFNQAICHFQQFWYDKLVLDYGITQKFSEELDWKRIYIHYLYRLIGLGSNQFGRLGLGQITGVKELTEIPTVAVMDVACGYHNTVIIDVDGNLWGTGAGFFGELGIDVGGQDVNKFIKLTNGLNFTQVACGNGYTIALTDDNKIWVTGSNDVGQIGLGSIDEVTQLTKLKEYRAKQIACGYFHSAFIDLNGNLYTFGDDFNYKLGHDRNKRVPGKVLIPGDIPIIQVACGGTHTVCIDGNNEIWVFGSSNYGQLGLGEAKSSIRYPEKISGHKAKFIFCGDTHTAFIDLEDHVWIFGNNKYGQLGLLEIGKQYIPKKIVQVYDGRQIVNLDFRVKEVYCGNGITLFIDFEENLWVTGGSGTFNINCKIPIKVPRIKASKVAVGINHMVMIGYYN